ncbi:MAG: adenosylmethionine--8-amino-7-oxononanoate transaminase [Candidatus Omnitrophica bacterium]|nr:adenosylmethionine--8-amino-7-oxononanoate transaminase [Candidatus Omnitrophota bacterium]
MDLAAKDKKYVWHPFTQMKDWAKEDILVIERGEGSYLIDTQGRRYLDGVSSLWCNVHGHQVPEIDQAIEDQLGKIAHTTFLGLTHPSAILLAEKLVKLNPGLSRVFYSDSGSEAVEIALKMAFQYWQHRGLRKKSKFVRLKHAYHGDTIGAVSVGGMDLFHEIFHPLLFKCFEAPSPYVYRWPKGGPPVKVRDGALSALESILKKNHREIAALIMEPLIQGAAGMITQPKGYISAVRKLTRRYNVLLIFDEVATGFGRTGTMFAYEQERAVPDLLTLAKGLTGGYLPLAATLASEEIYKAFLGNYKEFKAFFHGHTFTANPLACRAAIASLELFEKRGLLDLIQKRIAQTQKRWAAFKELSIVGDIRQAGLMIGIELVQNQKTKQSFDLKEQIGVQVIRRARAKGLILRPLGSVIVLMPVLSMSEEEVEKLLDITYESIKETNDSLSVFRRRGSVLRRKSLRL